MRLLRNYDTHLGTKFHHQASIILGYDCWVVIESFVYNLGDDKYVCVPTGFLTDGASVPRMLWNIIPPWGEYGQAAVMHDYLCEHGFISNGKSYQYITRKQADKILLEGLADLNTSSFTKYLMIAGVNLYRNIVNPKMPYKSKLKVEVERAIMSQYIRTGDFVLTKKQIAKLNLRKSLY